MAYKWAVRSGFLLLTMSVVSALHLAASLALLGGVLLVTTHEYTPRIQDRKPLDTSLT